MSLKCLDGRIETVFTSDAYIANLFYHHTKLSIPALYLCSTIILLVLVWILIHICKDPEYIKRDNAYNQFPNEYFNYLKTNWINQIFYSIFPSELLSLDILSLSSLVSLHIKMYSFVLLLKLVNVLLLNPFVLFLFYSDHHKWRTLLDS